MKLLKKDLLKVKIELDLKKFVEICQLDLLLAKDIAMSQDKEMKKNNNFGKMKGYFFSQIIGGRAGSSWRCDKR